MGAKGLSKAKLKRAKSTCNICGKKLFSALALRVHKLSHKANTMKPKPNVEASEQATRSKRRTINEESTSSLPKISVVSAEKLLKQSALSKGSTSKSSKDYSDIVYECPVLMCNLKYPTFNATYDHLKYFHNLFNENGEKTSSEAQCLPKPVIRDVLNKMKYIKSFLCLECNKIFSHSLMFNSHISGIHTNNVISLFFPSILEFQMWKVEMECETREKFVILDNTNKSKTVHHCLHNLREQLSSQLVSHLAICPASIMVLEYAKGIQVHFYNKHAGHTHDKYSLGAKYQKYAVKNIMENSSAKVTKTQEQSKLLIPIPPMNPLASNKTLPNIIPFKNQEDEFANEYMMFEGVIKYIFTNAKKANLKTLNLLHEKAMEMYNILDQHIKNDKVMNDDEIINALHTVDVPPLNIEVVHIPAEPKVPVRTSNRLKRHNTEEPVPTCRPDTENRTSSHPKIVSTVSLADKTGEMDALLSELKTEDDDAILIDDDNDNNVTPSSYSKRKSKGNPSKNVTDDSNVSEAPEPKIVKTSNPTDINKIIPPIIPNLANSSSPSFCNTFEDFLDKNFPDAKKAKKILKTKMGQFIPGSPKKSAHVETKKVVTASHKKPIEPKYYSNKNRCVPSVKPRLKESTNIPVSHYRGKDKSKSFSSKRSISPIDYEVKEQENDCNILILKI